MARFRLTVEAEQDFDGIGAYRQGRWGREHAVRYLVNLDGMFVTLATTPTLGRGRDDLRVGLLDYPCKQHMIFFRRDPDGNVEIIRVLHQRQDFERHL